MMKWLFQSSQVTKLFLCLWNYSTWLTFSMSSMQAAKSIPKSMNSHSIPSFLYSSCSRTNMWWLKNCCSFSLVKLMHSCSKLLNWFKKEKGGGIEYSIVTGQSYKKLHHQTYIKDFKSSNVEHTNEELSWLLCVQHLVNSDDHPQEHFLIDGLGESHDRIMHLKTERIGIPVISNKLYYYNQLLQLHIKTKFFYKLPVAQFDL